MVPSRHERDHMPSAVQDGFISWNLNLFQKMQSSHEHQGIRNF